MNCVMPFLAFLLFNMLVMYCDYLTVKSLFIFPHTPTAHIIVTVLF